MKLSTLIPLSLLLCRPLLASPFEDDIFGRSVGDACRSYLGKGTCKSKSKCKGVVHRGLCPNDPDDIRCCVDIPCKSNGKSGYCRSVSASGCSGGKFHPGIKAPFPCPGNADIQCCIKTPKPTSVQASTQKKKSVGQKVLEKAMTAKGKPYSWGAGSCHGATVGSDGERGFDCSGLVAWAVCQVTGRNLFAEGLRVTYSMYCAQPGRLKYKKYDLKDRKPGDAVFYGGSCDCRTPKAIYHVGLVMEDKNYVWNAPNNRINKVGKAGLNSFGKAPCPKVIRFT
ncbi:hypothetical protein AJ80_02346 [Polytolypa hystricis UAMH7299]|uniref:NlpC/P60 domain-containing protein n=1 Tax=Polytolypa hystricis (strain UAMH7299) TaxID=1447883 RepID=A0A2B7YPH9_POLH7|nr:hypothetical protein AJ80_02346 [Polytolypa hystricis UAMH7299]